jgi:hypothetical protein
MSKNLHLKTGRWHRTILGRAPVQVMLTPLRLSYFLNVVLLTSLPVLALSRPLPARSQSPEVPSSNVNNPACYMQTDNGRTLNLESLCTNKSTPSVNAPLNSSVGSPLNPSIDQLRANPRLDSSSEVIDSSGVSDLCTNSSACQPTTVQDTPSNPRPL